MTHVQSQRIEIGWRFIAEGFSDHLIVIYWVYDVNIALDDNDYANNVANLKIMPKVKYAKNVKY